MQRNGSRLTRLAVENFRNITQDIWSFDSKINYIYGKNGNGKTNLLEAISLLCSGRSFRKNSEFSTMLSFDGDREEFSLSALINDVSYSQRHTRFGVLYSRDGAIIRQRPRHATLFIGPNDFYTFFFTAQFRREWFDQRISTLIPSYKQAMGKLKKLLEIRNNILRSGQGGQKLAQIEAIDEELSTIIPRVTFERKSFVEKLQSYAREIFKEIFGENLELEVQLKKSLKGSLDPQSVRSALKAAYEMDLKQGVTTQGSHRDDYTLLLNGFDSFEFASNGQMKVVYLSLILGYCELFRYKFGGHPIILVDDFSNEIDSERWKRILHFLLKKDIQVFITTANKSYIQELNDLTGIRVIFLEHGRNLSS